MENMQKSHAIKIAIAVIGAIATIVAAILANEKFAEYFLGIVQRKSITIQASPAHSGFVVCQQFDRVITTFNESATLIVGDSERNAPVKTFISFYIGYIPPNAQILEAEFEFDYSKTGTTDGFGYLVLQVYDFDDYKEADFQNIPLSTESDIIGNWAKYRRGLWNTDALVQIIQSKLPSKILQLVVYIEDNKIIPNQHIDGLIMKKLPTLKIKYKIPS